MRASRVTIPLRPTAWLAITLLGAVFVACSEGTGPANDSLRPAVHGTQPAPTGPLNEPSPLQFASWAPPLETYDTTFELVQGTGSSDTIYFKKRPGDQERELFLVLDIPSSAAFVDPEGEPLAAGSTVVLSVKVDSKLVKLDFGPHGSTFLRKPARLSIWWQNTDLQARSGSGLQLWYQAEAGLPWNALATQVSAASTKLVADLFHFSNYAVAY